ncbi:gas vesicle protein GvpG [Streptomyces cinnamoneus]|uniref:Gas vesicle protein GvpG n=1 Tax=Streptomyces cinnamoneus TaxID=53446 RepID=A0A2G1XNW4_STRCJ|nr:gas vesicle protein GvpG [Streptomyces cinnamoneus]PHQ52881.1 gas vesicle protein GvpG [Streptomyces cinnamoneus]PPT11460.1 gas vesicle protein GvpG [Streptomyces cinnamoneus]
MIGLVGWVLRRLVDEAERLYYDPAVVQHQLKELEEQLVSGRIDEQEFDRREDALLDRLAEMRRRSEGGGAA